MKQFIDDIILDLLYVKRWLTTTNHKDIGILYLVFGLIAGIIGTLFSIIIRIELAYPGSQILAGNWQFYNVIVTAYSLIMIFIMVDSILLFINYVIILQSKIKNIYLLKLNIILKSQKIVEGTINTIKNRPLINTDNLIRANIKLQPYYNIVYGNIPEKVANLKALAGNTDAVRICENLLNSSERNILHPQLVLNIDPISKMGENKTLIQTLNLTSQSYGKVLLNPYEFVDILPVLDKEGKSIDGITKGIPKLITITEVPSGKEFDIFKFKSDKISKDQARFFGEKINESLLIDTDSFKVYHWNKDIDNCLNESLIALNEKDYDKFDKYQNEIINIGKKLKSFKDLLKLDSEL